MVYLDLSKAFDTVPHNELLYKLWSFGITGPLWFWLKSYLHNRYHFVAVEDKHSSMLPVLSGVPQGSILGPLLFLIYMNDLPGMVPFSNVFLFADDTKLFKTITSKQDCHQLQSDLNEVINWCKKWNLSMNSKKCKAMRFFQPVPDQSSGYNIETTQIDFVDNYKDLGIIMSSKLDWSKHYTYICSKAYASLHLVRRTVTSNNIQTKRRLYLALVRSHFSYCSQLWRPLLIMDIKRLEQVQRRATKYILGDYPLATNIG